MRPDATTEESGSHEDKQRMSHNCKGVSGLLRIHQTGILVMALRILDKLVYDITKLRDKTVTS
jgi:hypothetical protein